MGVILLEKLSLLSGSAKKPIQLLMVLSPKLTVSLFTENLKLKDLTFLLTAQKRLNIVIAKMDAVNDVPSPYEVRGGK